MSVTVCYFAGWVQVRLATNPDPPDETRGVSGYTFALPGEADLDRLLRSSDPVSPRTHAPPIGVFITRVAVDGIEVATHPLVGAQVRLRSDPRFESVNDVVMSQGVEALEPFDLEVSHSDFYFRRRDYLDLTRPDATVYDVPPALLQTRRLASVTMGTQIMQEAIGCTDPTAFRAARQARLEADLAHTKDPYQRAGLSRRISELGITDPQDRRTYSMQFIESRTYSLNGPIELSDPAGWLRGLNTFSTFACDITMGSWDADTLSAYATGSLALPTH
jgi:hypothetical protein